MPVITAQHPGASMEHRELHGPGPVLACIDDGPGGYAVARVASSLATTMGTKLLLATVKPAGAPTPGGAGHSPELVRRGRALLARAARELDQPAELRVIFGEPAERLIALAQREMAEAVVTCAPRAWSTRTSALESVYLALAGSGPCPVIVVPRNCEILPASGPILCGIDGSPTSLAAGRVASDLATMFDTRLRCIHVNDQDQAAQRLADVAERECATLLVVGSRGVRMDASGLLGSVSAQLARITACPLVIVPSQAPAAAQ